MEAKIEEARQDLLDAFAALAKVAAARGSDRTMVRLARELAQLTAHVAQMAGRLEMLLDL